VVHASGIDQLGEIQVYSHGNGNDAAQQQQVSKVQDNFGHEIGAFEALEQQQHE